MAGKEIEMGHCIRNCTDCHTACLETVSYCLERGGEHAEAAHLNLLLVCADICRVSADTMLRGADVHGVTCGACAEICERRSEEHTSELQSLMRISYAVLCLKKK